MDCRTHIYLLSGAHHLIQSGHNRKAWQYFKKVANTSAMLYCMIETAKANHIEPYQYLRSGFTKLPQAQTLEAIEGLLPWSIDLLKSRWGLLTAYGRQLVSSVSKAGYVRLGVLSSLRINAL